LYTTKERRLRLKEYLLKANDAVKGSDLACKYDVSRQVIVQDIAILRARGLDIIATPQGYLIPKENENIIKKVIAVNHTDDKDIMEDELYTIVDYGGKILDVIIDHDAYGEIKAILNISSRIDVKNFIKSMEDSSSNPISKLTSGMHFHTISVEREENMEFILTELRKKGYLID
jgi:transcriptional regulator of NAD metabolism